MGSNFLLEFAVICLSLAGHLFGSADPLKEFANSVFGIERTGSGSHKLLLGFANSYLGVRRSRLGSESSQFGTVNSDIGSRNTDMGIGPFRTSFRSSH